MRSSAIDRHIVKKNSCSLLYFETNPHLVRKDERIQYQTQQTYIKPKILEFLPN